MKADSVHLKKCLLASIDKFISIFASIFVLLSSHSELYHYLLFWGSHMNLCLIFEFGIEL